MDTAKLLSKIAPWRAQVIKTLRCRNPDLSESTLTTIVHSLLFHSVLTQLCQQRGLTYVSAPCRMPIFGLTSDRDLLQIHSENAVWTDAVIPLEMLGALYEQTNQIQSSRKVRGIYYTPTAVVDLMVRQTIGVLLEQRSVPDLDYINLSILDPACGAGAFLLGAYRYLLEWYHRHYCAAFDRYADKLYPGVDGNWHLTYEVRRDILRRHIYGVDIDPQAVEITKQVLVLQLWDGIATHPFAGQSSQASRFHSQPDLQSLSRSSSNQSIALSDLLEAVDLETNIRCGHALVESDYELQNPSEPPVKPFDWVTAFPTILDRGSDSGFDVVIGNPPWVFTRTADFNDSLKHYYWHKYLANMETSQRGKTKQTGKINLFTLFLLLFVRLLHPQGRSGIVVPNTLLRSTVYNAARKYLLDRCSIEHIIDLASDTFRGVTAAPTVLIVGKNVANTTVHYWTGLSHTITARRLDKQSFLKNTSYVFSVLLDPSQAALFEKMDALSIPLGTLTQAIIEGIVCRKDQITNVPPQPPFSSSYRRLLEGKDLQRYSIRFNQKYILFDRQQLHRPRPDSVWNAQHKIMLRRIGGGNQSLIAALDTAQYCTFASINNILLHENCTYDIRYILALLNSRLLNQYYTQKFTNQSKLTVNISKTFVEQLPVRSLNLSNDSERNQHRHLIELVDQIQSLHQEYRMAESAQKLDIQDHIHALDRCIDQQVYKLYQLTDHEASLVEHLGNARQPT